MDSKKGRRRKCGACLLVVYMGGESHTGGFPVIFALAFDRGRGMPRPYRATIFYCPVGRGDPTPPGKWAVVGNFPLISHLR